MARFFQLIFSLALMLMTASAAAAIVEYLLTPEQAATTDPLL